MLPIRSLINSFLKEEEDYLSGRDSGGLRTKIGKNIFFFSSVWKMASCITNTIVKQFNTEVRGLGFC